jgi:hypothetical protein
MEEQTAKELLAQLVDENSPRNQTRAVTIRMRSDTSNERSGQGREVPLGHATLRHVHTSRTGGGGKCLSETCLLVTIRLDPISIGPSLPVRSPTSHEYVSLMYVSGVQS